jgi:hypothetical protein
VRRRGIVGRSAPLAPDVEFDPAVAFDGTVGGSVERYFVRQSGRRDVQVGEEPIVEVDMTAGDDIDDDDADARV